MHVLRGSPHINTARIGNAIVGREKSNVREEVCSLCSCKMRRAGSSEKDENEDSACKYGIAIDQTHKKLPAK